MAQRASADDDFRYLADKHWIAYRPTSVIDPSKLRQFVDIVLTTAADRKKAYDYTGALGIWNNATTRPTHPSQIHKEYTCTTLILAALHYAEHPVDGIHRGGFLDIVTPAQVVRSRRLE